MTVDPWQRLSARMIGVDVARTVLSTLPAVVAVVVFGADAGGGQVWPLIGLAVFGALGAAADALRWVFTRFRITGSHVEIKTGVVVRRHRSIQRDRIRSVDVEAKLRHRIAGLRIVKIGAGQQSAAGESALALDAVSVAGAIGLKERLLSSVRTEDVGTAVSEEPADRTDPAPLRVFRRYEPRWVVYNVFSVWAYVLALGVGGGLYWLLESLGIDVTGFVRSLAQGNPFGATGTVVIAFLAVSLFGVAGLAVSYVAEYWDFELARVQGPEGTVLRTRRGLFTTREVNRDENRIRGIQLSEPLLWRWMGASDTAVITTGLGLWSMSQPTAILPRGPVATTSRIAADVLGADGDPLHAALAGHPRAALQRRLWWATGLTLVVGLGLAWLVVTEVVPVAAFALVAVLWPIGIGAAVIAHRALGHAIVGPYLVTRSGLVSRATTVLQRSAVSTIVVRESLLQRRLGLRTVSTMTAAGYGGYDTLDLDADAAVAFALDAAPGLLDPFVHDGPVPTEPASGRPRG